MNIVRSYRSTNGRYGLDIVSSVYGENDSLPLKGRVIDLGEVDRIRVIRVEPDPSCHQYLVEGEVVEGGKLLVDLYLQSSRHLRLSIIGPIALVKYEGYKGRWSNTVLFRDGVAQELSPSQLLALGLIDGETPAQDVIAPPVSDAMAMALRKAGLA